MPPIAYTHLTNRGIISVTGSDSRDFLQGIISNDITLVSPNKTIYAALLTPQGKYLFDFFISQSGEKLLIECEKDRVPDLMKRLRIYKLRANADLVDETETYSIFAIWGDDAAQATGLHNERGLAHEILGGTQFIDPRLNTAGVRSVLPIEVAEAQLQSLAAEPASASDYDLHRLKLGLPDASRDLVVDKAILIESGFDELNGVDWNKGCYMGQELTARTKYRGLVKKRLISVFIEGAAPEPGTPIMVGDKNAGEMRSSNAGHGIALLRLDQLNNEAAEYICDQAILRPNKPTWADF
ncbi:MAG: folate-binding protein [Rhodospirillales bacterium]|nr:folate-binding protein [Rhodospirillales bacterium]